MSRIDPSPDEAPEAADSAGGGPERPPGRLEAWLRVPWTRWLERALLVGLVLFAAPRFIPQFQAYTGLGEVEDGPTPAFAVRTLDEEALTSESLRGKVVLVNFWATWCPPCRVEMPALQAVWELHRDDGLVVLGVSTDIGGEEPIVDFMEEREITFPVARADSEIRSAFGGIPGLPTTFILDRDGRVRHRVVGYFAPPAMRAAVERLLEAGEGGPGRPGTGLPAPGIGGV